MTPDSQKHHRRSIRLKGYDYSQAGAYFITGCVQDRACLFGEVADGQMHLNDAGRIVLAEWNQLAVRFPTIELDVFGVMPNHIHGIIVLSNVAPNPNAGANGNVGAGLVPAPVLPTPVVPNATLPNATSPVAALPTVGIAEFESTTRTVVVPGATTRVAPTLGDVVGAFKSLTTDLYIQGVKQSGWPNFRGRLWQRNYYEHIIRNGRSLRLIQQYILDNPAHWASDRENPVNRPIAAAT